MALDIAEQDLGGTTVLSVSGGITLGEESNSLRTKVKEVLGRGVSRLILDLGGVTYIDSTGLGAIVAGYTTARNQGASLKLANLTRSFHSQLQITNLLSVFEVYDTVEEAAKSFS